MSTKRRLSQDKEREVCIAYLVGVSVAYIQQPERWGISKPRITQLLHESHVKSDQIVVRYRVAPPQRRGANAAHLILSWHDEITEDEQIPTYQFPRDAYAALITDRIDPMREQIAAATRLERMVSLEPRDGYSRLLETVLGEKLGVGLPLIARILKKQYEAGIPFSLDDTAQEAEMYVLRSIRDGGLYIGPQKRALIGRALEALPLREVEVLKLRFGLEGEEPLTLDELGAHFHVSRECIRQVEAKAFRKLRHPTRRKYLVQAGELRTEEETAAFLHEDAERREEAKWKYRLYPVIREEIEREVKTGQGGPSSDVLQKSVEDLELSIRSFNTLRAAEIKTIGELLGQSDSKLLRYRNFGRKSLREIDEVLSGLGLVRREAK